MQRPTILADTTPRPISANSAAVRTTIAPRNSSRKPSHLQNHKPLADVICLIHLNVQLCYRQKCCDNVTSILATKIATVQPARYTVYYHKSCKHFIDSTDKKRTG